MVHVHEKLSIRTPVQWCIPLNLHRRRNVKYVELRTTFEVDDLQTPARVLLRIVVPERDQFTVRRNCRPDRDTFGNSFRRTPVDRHTPETKGIVRVRMLEKDPLTIGRKRGPRALRRFKRQLLRTAAVAIDPPNLKHAGAV